MSKKDSLQVGIGLHGGVELFYEGHILLGIQDYLFFS
jgi:hypothetical protein